MGRTFDSYDAQTLENHNEAWVTYLQSVLIGAHIIPFNTDRTVRELLKHLELVRTELAEMHDLLLRAEDAIETLDGTSVENEKLVDDFRTWKGS